MSVEGAWSVMQWGIIFRDDSRDKLMYGVPVDRTQMLGVSDVISVMKFHTVMLRGRTEPTRPCFFAEL